jgi:predicted phosphodiesterase
MRTGKEQSGPAQLRLLRVGYARSSSRLLVLSGLHFEGPQPDPIGEAELIIDALRDCPVDAILLMGDYTSKADLTGFHACAAFVNRLKAALSENPLPLIRLVGNHDVVFQKGDSPYDQLIRHREALRRYEENFSSVVSPSPGVASGPSTWTIHRIQGKPDPNGKEAPVVWIYGFNSSRLETPPFVGLGYLGVDRIYEAISAVDGNQSGNFPAGSTNEIAIAVTHYNPLPVDLDEGKGNADHLTDISRRSSKRTLSFLADDSDLLAAIETLGIGVLAHGHTHSPHHMVEISGYQPHRVGMANHLTVFDCGAFAALDFWVLRSQRSSLPMDREFEMCGCLTP